MLDMDCDLLESNPEWRHVLSAYQATDEVPHSTDAETADLFERGFRPRVREVSGIAADQMTRIHGKLIAHGFLQVEITGRAGGMLYQLTQTGRRACLRVVEQADAESLDEGINESSKLIVA